MTLIPGDCLIEMQKMDANSIDSIVTDPPYGYEFMGKDWDHGVPGVPFWQEALRVCKPGAMLLAFGGTRTHHRLMVAIEDAGWEIRDCIMWVYGSGFPKSKDISKAIDAELGAERKVIGQSNSGTGPQPNKLVNHAAGDTGIGYMDGSGKTFDLTEPATDAAKTWQGYGTALKPAWEPIIVAMKPIDHTYAHNALTWGVAGMNVEAGRIPIDPEIDDPRLGGNGSWTTNKTVDFVYGHYAGDVINSSPQGRWPANLIHDSSDEVLSNFPANAGASAPVRGTEPSQSTKNAYGEYTRVPGTFFNDAGSAARFFYCAKASRAERELGLDDLPIQHRTSRPKSDDLTDRTIQERLHGRLARNHHPTVKPLALMRYLIRLVKPPAGGVILDPFAGSGTTGMACVAEHADFIGIEIDPEYVEIARYRIAAVPPTLL